MTTTQTLNEKYQEALSLAKQLPTHINGKLQDHYVFFEDEKKLFEIIYVDKITPAIVFENLFKGRKNGATRYYINIVPTYREDGSLKKKNEWNKVLMFHKAYSRTDIEVPEVKFDIVGLKRRTTQLSAGVLISNVKYIIN